MSRSKRRGEEKTSTPLPLLPANEAQKATGTGSMVHELIAFYHDTFLREKKSKPVIPGGMYGKISKDILRGRPFAEAKWMVEEFFRNTPQPFADRNQFGLEHILRASQTLLSRSHKPTFSQEEK